MINYKMLGMQIFAHNAYMYMVASISGVVILRDEDCCFTRTDVEGPLVLSELLYLIFTLLFTLEILLSRYISHVCADVYLSLASMSTTPRLLSIITIKCLHWKKVAPLVYFSFKLRRLTSTLVTLVRSLTRLFIVCVKK